MIYFMWMPNANAKSSGRQSRPTAFFVMQLLAVTICRVEKYSSALGV